MNGPQVGFFVSCLPTIEKRCYNEQAHLMKEKNHLWQTNETCAYSDCTPYASGASILIPIALSARIPLQKYWNILMHGKARKIHLLSWAVFASCAKLVG